MPFQTVNPATGEAQAAHPSLDAAGALEAADRAWSGFLQWRDTSFEDRAGRLRAAAGILRDEADRFGTLMAREMGKPLAQGVGEAEKCAWVLEYYAEHGAAFLADEPQAVEGARAYWSYRPLGVVLGIMPWNFPFWQVFRAVGPTLMAGNAVLLKHAPGVPRCALACAEVFHRAEIPEDVYQNLFVEESDVAAVMGHPGVRGVTFTGSVRGGRAVATAAGAHLKKCVLELGGSDPYVLLSDADVARAADACLASRLLNTGQSCISAKRLIVVDGLHDEFLERIQTRFAGVVMGDPLKPDTDIGPLARVDLRDELHRQVRESVTAGARLVVGGEIPDRPGAWYPATVLAEVTAGMPAYHEELFGPVAVVIRAEDDDDALRIANDTSFGLGAAVFTEDRARGERLAREHLDAGACFVNDFVRSDPRLPFGGVKESGYGRELSALGIREFTNAKTVWVAV